MTQNAIFVLESEGRRPGGGEFVRVMRGGDTGREISRDGAIERVSFTRSVSVSVNVIIQ